MRIVVEIDDDIMREKMTTIVRVLMLFQRMFEDVQERKLIVVEEENTLIFRAEG